MRKILVMAAALMAAAATVSASDDPFTGVLGLALGVDEAAAIEGGDIFLELNEARDTIKVHVEFATKTPQGRPTRVQYSYDIPAHNRVLDTKEAGYMPAGGVRPAELKGKGKLTSQPAQFPAGTWKITEANKRTDRFGPNIMKTNAVGTVDVFDSKGKVQGSFNDEGYAIHSNNKPFEESRSWGCIIVKENDNKNLAQQIREDKEREGEQTLTVVKQKVARKTGDNY